MANNAVPYGFISSKSLLAQKVTTIGITEVRKMISDTLELHNREVMGLIGSAVEVTTEFKFRNKIRNGSHTLQPVNEYGSPLPAGHISYYDVALPIYGAGTAWGTNRISRAKMTLGDVADFTADAILADLDWLRRRILAAWFDSAGYTYVDDLYGSLSILGLANGDTQTYLKKSGLVETDTHYLAQASSIDNSNNPFPTIYAELDEHAGASGEYIAYVPSNLVTSIQALTNLYEPRDVDVSYLVTDQLSQAYVNNNSSQYFQNAGFGTRLIGKCDGVWIKEWPNLPSNYIVAHAMGNGAFIGMREYEESSLRGFFPEEQNVDGNMYLNKFLRYAGFGVIQRHSALAYRIGNASWAVPTGYATPLAV